jgi:DNA polymerase-3 subunit chi
MSGAASDLSRQIDFYHLTDVDFSAPAALIADKSVTSGHKLLMLASKPVAASLSDALWTTRPDSFLAHGIDAEEGLAHAPVWISTEPDKNPIEADFLLLTAGLEMDDMQGFRRVFNLFNGAEETALAKAREQWKSWSTQGSWHCRYFARSETGGWQQKA